MVDDPTRSFPFDTVWGHVASPAVGRVLRTRLEQIAGYGHTPEKDDDTGAHALVSMTRSRILKILQHDLTEMDRLLQMAGDDTMGRIDRLSDRELANLDRQLSTALAMGLATMELLDRERARRPAPAPAIDIIDTKGVRQ